MISSKKISTGQVNVNSSGFVTIEKSETSWTLSNLESNKEVICNSLTDITITVNSDSFLNKGDKAILYQIGAGKIEFITGTGTIQVEAGRIDLTMRGSQ